MPRPRCSDRSAATSTSQARDRSRPIASFRCRQPSDPMSVRLDHGEDTLAALHEINVTPFIDVMLVLLIIFMVAAPLATVDVAVNLPASTAEPQPRPDKPIFLTVKADLSLALGEITIARETLGGALASVTKGDKDTRIFLRADRT